MRALVTGANGFLGRPLCRALKQASYSVTGVDRLDRTNPDLDRLIVNDLSNREAVATFLAEVRPDLIFHLAGVAFPPQAWREPASVLTTNAIYSIQLFEVLREQSWKGRLIFASSSDVYGSPGPEELPLREEATLKAVTPYAASKLCCEMFIEFFLKDLDLVIVRPFNNIGPGQRPQYVLPSILNRIVEARTEGRSSMEAGDLEATRDFIDVRDVAHALVLIAGQKGGHRIYNICRGQPVKIAQLLELCFAVTNTRLQIKVNPDLLRREGPDCRYGSPDRLRALGWQPQYELRQTIEDTWRALALLADSSPAGRH